MACLTPYALNAIGVVRGVPLTMAAYAEVSCAAGALTFLTNPVSDLCLLWLCHQGLESVVVVADLAS